MDDKKEINVDALLQTENDQLNKLHEIVKMALDEEALITRKVTEDNTSQPITLGQQMADKVASFGGSWTFITIFGSVLALWIVLNSVFLMQKAFDPYPYILLNLILSCLAAIQAPIIMMSQNRQETKDRLRSESDYLINLKSELEIRSLHQKIDLSLIDQFKYMSEMQQVQLEMLRQIDARLRSAAAS